MCGGTGRVHERRAPLQVFQHLFVFLAGLDARDAQRDDFQTAQLAPLGRKLLIQCVGQLGGMAGQGRVADAHLADPGERRLKGSHQFGLQLAVQCVTGVGVFHIAADVGVEQDGVGDAVAVLAEAPYADVNVNAGALVHDPEGYRAGCAVLVADQLLGVDVVDALVGRRLTAKGEPLADLGENFVDVLCQTLSGKERGLGAGAVSVLAGFRAEVNDLALLDDEGALTLGNGDEGAVRDDVFRAAAVCGTAGSLLFAFNGEDVRRESVTREKFLPLVGHHTGCRANSSFDKTHKPDSPLYSQIAVKAAFYQYNIKKGLLKGFPSRGSLNYGLQFSQKCGTIRIDN